MNTQWLSLALASSVLVGSAVMTSNPAEAAGVGENPPIGVNRTDIIRGDAPELAAHGDYSTGITTLRLTHPEQIDVVNTTDDATPRYDRPLTVEVWYPAEPVNDDQADRTSVMVTRDAQTTATLVGRAARDATPLYDEGPYPLILLSHGYPGNRYLMAHFGENLASKGFIVASIDHTDSTYRTQAAFVSTLRNRSLDQNFVLQHMARLSQESGFWRGLVDADHSGILGYSMGGYGALNTVGAGLADGVTSLPLGTPAQLALLETRKLSHPEYADTVDERFRAIIAIGPWGAQVGLWDAEGLANIDIPVMIIGGSVDDVSDYDNGIRAIYRGLTTEDRSLLTFINANHNAAAPMAAPREVYATGEGLDHYTDAVWDNTRMNNITQHFATAFFELHLKGDESRRDYLTPAVEYAADSEPADAETGTGGTTWKGFKQRDAVGLRYEYR
ncbi:MAG: alpha/beta hydrolase family protein [Saccharospirillum sp.]